MQIIPVTAAGGVLYKAQENQVQVLLIYRRGVWDLPKGKLEGKETIKECAQREVSEEVGCPIPVVLDKLTTTYHEYQQGDEYFGKTTHWYAMKTNANNGFEPELVEEITEVAWVPLGKANRKVGFQNLRDVLSSFENWISMQ